MRKVCLLNDRLYYGYQTDGSSRCTELFGYGALLSSARIGSQCAGAARRLGEDQRLSEEGFFTLFARKTILPVGVAQGQGGDATP